MIDLKPASWFEEKLPEAYLVEENFKEIIKKNYSLSWFTSIDTPNIEKIETLLAKWVEENEIYWVKRLKSEDKNEFEIGLRFDLTVPLARYVSKYKWEISFPFKRQHIWRVYRWERPQKWRYREFYQADIDIIWNGSLPLFADVEIISTLYNSLLKLNFWEFVININNRKLLWGFLEAIGVKNIEKAISILDKKDKLNLENLEKMFQDENLLSEEIKQIFNLIELSEKKDWIDVLLFFEKFKKLSWPNLLSEGIEELKYIYENLLNIWVDKSYIKINPTISRGLNYYTWTVMETFIVWAENIWSIASGGRYENLCSSFSWDKYPWVWCSIWLSRLISILSGLWKINYDIKTVSSVLVLNTWKEFLQKNLEIVKYLREEWINTEFYLDSETKLAKQIKYADKKWIRFVIINWEDEMEKNLMSIKDLKKGEQYSMKINEVKSVILGTK